MSPYGSAPPKPPRETLASTSYSNEVGGSITVHHVNKDSCPKDLLEILFEEFDKELAAGRTYPQEGPIGIDGFRDYFFHGDVFVGIIAPPGATEQQSDTPSSVEAARAGRNWGDCVAGSYYVHLPKKCYSYQVMLTLIWTLITGEG